ncbi:MAG: group II intron reverse transcriptase/maturase [Planctomycetes bacterium]|nr:group II intron reverse transcriptase/maturase [Planctomycetota bacterium]
MSLTPPDSVQKLQKTLHDKAKGSPDCRFHSLYDKVYRRDVLAHAYEVCRNNGGAAGVDGRTFEDIEAYGVERWLDDRTEELRNKTYRPKAVRRVWIPKPNGGQRPLGIPTIADRVIQTAALLVLEPIFEADLQPEQHAYRAGKNTLDAVNCVHKLVSTGHNEVVDADLKGYFDTIPHAELMKSLARRVSDGPMLHLLKMWLETAVEERDERGRVRRTTRNKDEGRGTPQGAPISPLLSNLYMRRFVLGWKQLGHAERLRAHIVNYADDFVICCRGSAHQALAIMRGMMAALRLRVNDEKTRLCRVGVDTDETFDFLGYTIGRCHSPRTGRAYIGTRPSARKIRRCKERISELTDRRGLGGSAAELIAAINRALRGWWNYFRLGHATPAYRALDAHARARVRRWLRLKHKAPKGSEYRRFPDTHLHDRLGLVRLVGLKRSFP